ncbi:aminopeptidase N [Sneathiella sp. CAU 1612]|uniref:Aminopeptidase N n=1 Tax=Sneathiella sedimenti TaxID=2816034 RepID=A0ABS3F850_9PROT|nr:aminopeptidase N [Sneathiella sedimenti]MBO0334701.1 aminopeptidase N [Sneathiella sedimenti]
MSKSSAKPATIYLKDYKEPDFLIETVDLTVELGEEETIVTSRLAIKRNDETATKLSLNGEHLTLQSVKMDGHMLTPDEYSVTDEWLHLPVAAITSEFSLEIITRIKPQENTALEGLYKSSGNFCTQCEAEGFRRITYFLDRPDVMAIFTTTIVGDGDRYPVMLSNGNLTLQETLPDGRKRVTWQDPHPKPAYLFALVAGDLAVVEDKFTTRSGRDVKLQIFVEKGNEDKCDHAMTSLKKSMKWDEEKYGREYDLDIFMIVAVSDFNMGAMENKGLNIFNSKYVLASPETATDADFDGIESVIAHEYFHNWTGNRITCRDWFQLTLKEGLTVFRDQQFSADMNSAPVQRISDVQGLRAAQFPEDAGPLAHPIQPQSYVEINNFYTATVYEKGAEVIRMIHTILGEENFRKGMDLYFERHDGQAVTTEEFIAALEDGSGIDLTQFRRWYITPGTPEITVNEKFDAETGQYTLTLAQTNLKAGKDPEPLHIPLKLGLLDVNGNAVPFSDGPFKGETEGVFDLTKKRQSFTFSGFSTQPRASLFRGFSAPVKIRQESSDDALAFFFAKDEDLFNRWDAGQRLASNILLKQIEDAGDGTSLPSAFLDAFAETLSDKTLDRAFTAAALTLPGEQDIAQKMPVVDVDAIHRVREGARRQIGLTFEDDWRRIYEECENAPSPANQPASSSRKLKNTALSYLIATGQEEFITLADSQYRKSKNMTDSVAALAGLKDINHPVREAMFADYYEKWQKDALIVDKWFTLQAMATRESTIDDIKALMEHPAFTLRNPNRLRSLIGAFASGNPVYFHDKSGDGYRILSGVIAALNKTNPQIAARLVAPLGQWRRYDKDRQDLMVTELEKILKLPDLSDHVYEMANKSLHN